MAQVELEKHLQLPELTICSWEKGGRSVCPQWYQYVLSHGFIAVLGCSPGVREAGLLQIYIYINLYLYLYI